jgi:hypothetical protein
MKDEYANMDNSRVRAIGQCLDVVEPSASPVLDLDCIDRSATRFHSKLFRIVVSRAQSAARRRHVNEVEKQSTVFDSRPLEIGPQAYKKAADTAVDNMLC